MKPITEVVTYKNHYVVDSTRAEILQIIDNICSKNNLRYFAFSKLVVGAVHYNDFIPKGLKAPAEIGLIRDEYEKLCELLIKDGPKYQLEIEQRYPSGAKALQLTVGKPVEIDEEDLVVTDIATVIISAFDYIPDTEAEQKSYFRKVQRLNKKYDRMVNCTPPKSYIPMRVTKAARLFWNTLFYSTRNPKKTYRKLLDTVKNSYKDTKYIRRLVPKRSAIVKVDDIFPTQRVRVNSATINIPKVVNYWTVALDDKLMEQTKTIQKIDLVLLKELDRVCRIIGVGYFVCGGTMLGYKRHGGFIPWDDDIDVGMLRADYNKLLKEGPKYFSEDFFLQTRQNDPTIPYLFSKLRLNGTTYITNFNEKRKFHKGICVDLFPFDYIPNSLNERQHFYNSTIFWKNINHKLFNRYHEKAVYDEPAKTSFERRARFINEFRRRLVHLIPLKFTQWLYIRHVTQYNKKAKEMGLTTVACFTPTYTYADVDKMIPYQDINFEGITVMALKDIDSFLTMQYKDYMQLPLLHQRVGHDLISWSVDDYIAEKYHIYDDTDKDEKENSNNNQE